MAEEKCGLIVERHVHDHGGNIVTEEFIVKAGKLADFAEPKEGYGFILESKRVAELLGQGRLKEGSTITSIHVTVNRGLRHIKFGHAELFRGVPNLQFNLLGSKIYEGISRIYGSVYRGFVPVHASKEVKIWMHKKGNRAPHSNPAIEVHNKIMQKYIAAREAKQKSPPKPGPRRTPRRTPKP